MTSTGLPFRKVLIANRGAIACRIIRTLRGMGIASVAVFSQADAGSRHVAEADEAVPIGPAPASESYLDAAAIIAAARATGAEAIHPGYGFLSENTEFAKACEAAGIVFIGPTSDNIRAFGLKHTARDLAQAHGVPLAPGTGLLRDPAAAAIEAERIGYPVILKATAGGGGIGMKVCNGPGELAEAFAMVARLGAGNFGDAGVFLERYVSRARHIEVQVFGDGAGRVVALGERDCSLQRRNQKVVEETPAPLLPAATRDALIAAAVRLTAGAQYRSAGTVEFLYDAERDDFYFLEVNTRLQVEHGVTEQVTGVDLVEWMVRGAAGDFAFLDGFAAAPVGHSIQVRLYAEDPGQDFQPSSGRLIDVAFPAGDRATLRVDGWVESGSEVPAWYDPMLAKLIVTAPTRAEAIAALQSALDATRLAGIETNLRWLRAVVRDPGFVAGHVSTRALADFVWQPAAIRVLGAGAATTVQDYPGRTGLWDVGVPPSGPMDALSFRLGNRLLGNAESAAGLEVTAAGPVLQFQGAARICLTGADCAATLDGVALPRWTPVAVAAGQVLRVGRVQGGGMRAYVLFAGGIDAPVYLGSRSAFTLGEFGGHAGRAVMTGDTLHLAGTSTGAEGTLAPALVPPIGHDWTVRVLYGPHGAPDFFTPGDIAMICETPWQVHYNSNRTGVRLVGPKPAWARRDGGEAGLHPSNIHDNAYAIGAVDFTGDMPIILGPDGPSLGGFVCPFVVIQADLWKVGQLSPGDTVHFRPVSESEARAAEMAQDALVATLTPPPAFGGDTTPPASPVLHTIAADGARPAATYRRQGDRHLLVEYGPIVLDLELRLRVHALMLELERLALPGVIDVTPGVRSLQIHYDARVLAQDALMAALVAAEERLGGLDDFAIPSRTVHLPLSWADPAIYQTIDKYMAAVRDDAPWCPDNIEFIRRVNGLDSVDEVQRIVFDAEYLVLGLGDVYLGAPVATPVDPRHRLVTTKYNPARTWTPPNVVGIGGAYMCIYGMEGPGGYQLFGRTIQVWNTWVGAGKQADAFADGKPWLLRFFDRIRFFPVSHDELTEWRRDFPLGRRPIRIEETTFRLADYRAFRAANAAGIAAFEATRQAAFDAERARWQASGEFDRVAALVDAGSGADGDAAAIDLPHGSELVEAPFGGSVWKMLASEGHVVALGDPIAVIEAMKMECPVPSPSAGVVRRIYVSEGQVIQPGSAMMAIEPGMTGAASIARGVNLGLTSAEAEARGCLARIAAYAEIQPAVWIRRLPEADVIAMARTVDARLEAGEVLPLAGVPFAIKDNIDLAGCPTTAGCPDFAYDPAQSATVVARLIAAGAVPVGKTNLDQFATGLNGTRSPYGAPACAFNRAYVSGGSSSGSAIAVAAGLVPIALGTDTAGSGRVPASFNGLIGFKPTKGRWSTAGLVPACRSIDCITVFAHDAADAALVDAAVAGADAADPWSRPLEDRALTLARVGVPLPHQRQFFGDLAAERMYAQALDRLAADGVELVEIDLAPLSEAARLLYDGPWVAERTAALGDFLHSHRNSIDPVVRTIVEGGLGRSAVDAFQGQYRLAELKQQADAMWRHIDALCLPTAPTIYRLAEMRASPIALNSNLGLYTNFVNLLDMAAIAVPAGWRRNGTGFGVTLIGPAWTDRALIDCAARWGAGDPFPHPPLDLETKVETVLLAVVGAHLEGMPLHWQLTSRNAKHVATTTTAPSYRLYAMADSVPPKPALIHDATGAAIAVEVYELDMASFGSFVAEVPPPLAIGTVTLADGSSVKGFVAEPRAIAGAADITDLGGWRAYIASRG